MRPLSLSRLFVGLAALAACAEPLTLPPQPDTDDRPPSFTGVSATPAFARIGTTVTFVFDASEALPPDRRAPLPNPAVTFAGAAMSCAANALAYTCTAEVTPAMGEGARGFRLEAADAAGNVSAPFEPAAAITLDFTGPTLQVETSPPEAVRGAAITFRIRSDEPLGGDPVVRADFLDGPVLCGGASAAGEIVCAGMVGADAVLGPAAFSVGGADRAGNPAAAVPGLVPVRDPDTRPPALTGFVLAPAVARLGTVVELAFDASEPLPATAPGLARNPRVTLAGAPLACTGEGLRYHCSLEISGGFATGVHAFEVTAADAAGNVTGPLVPDPRLLLDFDAPHLTARTTPAPASLGEPVAFTVQSDEPLDGSPVIEASFLDGPAPCGTPTVTNAVVCIGTVSPNAPRGDATYLVRATDRAGNEADPFQGTLTLERAAHPPPVMSVDAIVPAVARQGDELHIACSADEDLYACSASVAGEAADCIATGVRDCDCTLPVGTAQREGIAVVACVGSNVHGSGSGTGAVTLDFTPPVLDATKLRIVRRPMAVDEEAAIDPGAATEKGPSYAARSVAAVRVWAAASGGAGPLVVLVPGTTTSAALTGTDGSTGHLAPRQLWASAVDAVGNESARVLFGVGTDTTGPVPQAGFAAIGRAPIGQRDAVSGPAASFADTSAIASVLVFDDATRANSGTSPIATGPARDDDGFDGIAVGTTTASYPRLWVAAVDKCGIRGAAMEATGSDTTPPTADGSLLTFTAAPIGRPDGLEGASGAVAEPLASLRELRVFSAATAGTELSTTPFLPAADGGFSRVFLADSGATRGWLQVTDKAGNSARFAARRFHAEIDLAGRTPFDSTKTAAALYAYGTPEDATGYGPGLGPLRSGEASASDSAAASAVDGTRAQYVADTSSRAAGGWTMLAATPAALVREIPMFAWHGGRRRIVLFGGAYNTSWFGDTWELDPVNGWVQQAPAASPSSRGLADMVWDAGAGRTVGFGGRGPGASYFADTWTYDSAGSWKAATGAGPPGTVTAGLAYDAARGRVVAYGGPTGTTSVLNDTWEFDGTSWTKTPAPGPAGPRYIAALAYDPVRARTILFGSEASTPYGTIKRTDTWAWDGTAWTELAIAPPATTPSGPRIVFDPNALSLAMLSSVTPTYREAELRPDTGAWSMRTWATPTAVTTSALYARIAADPVAGRLVEFGMSPNTQTWTRPTEHLPERSAAQAILLPVEPLAQPDALSVTWVGSGTDGAGNAGVLLSAWDWTASRWTTLGTHAAGDADSATARTISAALTGDLTRFLRHGRLWLLASTPVATGSRAPTVSTDDVRLVADYTLP